MSLFADDAKLLKKVGSGENCGVLQEDLNKISEQSHRWEMEFNPEKCKVMEFGKSVRKVKENCVKWGEVEQSRRGKESGCFDEWKFDIKKTHQQNYTRNL